jgi:hypothetical protein
VAGVSICVARATPGAQTPEPAAAIAAGVGAIAVAVAVVVTRPAVTVPILGVRPGAVIVGGVAIAAAVLVTPAVVVPALLAPGRVPAPETGAAAAAVRTGPPEIPAIVVAALSYISYVGLG